MSLRNDFLAVARSALALLRDAAVTVAWLEPSALPGFSVGGLAGHLAYQVLSLPEALAAPVPVEPVVSVLDHYARVAWIGAAPDAEINVRIRRGGDELAAAGPAALACRLARAIDDLGPLLAVDRPVRIPLWGPWALRLDDMLLTRLMELAVHSDDLAVSAGVPTPPLPPAVVEAVVALLSRLALRRHGAVAVLRALTRAERALTTIAAW